MTGAVIERPSPRPAQPARAETSAFVKGPVLDLRRVCILVVEDARFMSGIVTSVLKALGIGRMLTADGLEQARDILVASMALSAASGRSDIDIVLANWELPNEGGAELLRWMREYEDEALRFMPMIAMSSYPEERVVCMARDLGANEFIAKPFSVTSLCGRLLSIINHPRPFVKAPGFFGPDRRRKVEPFDGGERRRQLKVKVNHE
jgi:DNA-binding response OmpR family regulator